MNILENIMAKKAKDLEYIMQKYPINILQKSPYFDTENNSIESYIRDPNNVPIIAEFKRKSPSKGVINHRASLKKIVSGYQSAAVVGISVLTETNFFGADDNDFSQAKALTKIPILRKDFIFCEYQVIESKSMGADIILIIAKALSNETIQRLSKLSKQLKMDVLLEIDSQKDLFKINEYVTLVGINNRNLDTFDVSLENSLNLIDRLPKNVLKISESGIDKVDTIKKLKSIGFQAFLIGEFFMKSDDPAKKCIDFASKLRYSLK